jgi:hypothetical protein
MVTVPASYDLILRYSSAVRWSPPVAAWTPPDGVEVHVASTELTEIWLTGIVSHTVEQDGSVRATNLDGAEYTAPPGGNMTTQ